MNEPLNIKDKHRSKAVNAAYSIIQAADGTNSFTDTDIRAVLDSWLHLYGQEVPLNDKDQRDFRDCTQALIKALSLSWEENSELGSLLSPLLVTACHHKAIAEHCPQWIAGYRPEAYLAFCTSITAFVVKSVASSSPNHTMVDWGDTIFRWYSSHLANSVERTLQNTSSVDDQRTKAREIYGYALACISMVMEIAHTRHTPEKENDLCNKLLLELSKTSLSPGMIYDLDAKRVALGSEIKTKLMPAGQEERPDFESIMQVKELAQKWDLPADLSEEWDKASASLTRLKGKISNLTVNLVPFAEQIPLLVFAGLVAAATNQDVNISFKKIPWAEVPAALCSGKIDIAFHNQTFSDQITSSDAQRAIMAGSHPEVVIARSDDQGAWKVALGVNSQEIFGNSPSLIHFQGYDLLLSMAGIQKIEDYDTEKSFQKSINDLICLNTVRQSSFEAIKTVISEIDKRDSPFYILCSGGQEFSRLINDSGLGKTMYKGTPSPDDLTAFLQGSANSIFGYMAGTIQSEYLVSRFPSKVFRFERFFSHGESKGAFYWIKHRINSGRHEVTPLSEEFGCFQNIWNFSAKISAEILDRNTISQKMIDTQTLDEIRTSIARDLTRHVPECLFCRFDPIKNTFNSHSEVREWSE